MIERRHTQPSLHGNVVRHFEPRRRADAQSKNFHRPSPTVNVINRVYEIGRNASEAMKAILATVLKMELHNLAKNRTVIDRLGLKSAFVKTLKEHSQRRNEHVVSVDPDAQAFLLRQIWS